jgi:hypothetical protein
MAPTFSREDLAVTEVNDLKLLDLPPVLRQETLMQGHWLLATSAASRCRALHSAGIKRASDLFALNGDMKAWASFPERAGVPAAWLEALHNLLVYHRYKTVAVSRLTGMAQDVCRRLGDRGLLRSDSLIAAVRTGAKREDLAKETGINLTTIESLASKLDLMRKPGIKDVKVGLFMKAGVRSLRELGEQHPDAFRERLAAIIRERRLPRAVPTPKEVRSDVCWARVYPVVIIL